MMMSGGGASNDGREGGGGLAGRRAADLLCVDHVAQNESWVHSPSRNGMHCARYTQQHSCLLPAARYSRRLLDLLVEELREGVVTCMPIWEARTFDEQTSSPHRSICYSSVGAPIGTDCEARALTACANRSWCVAGDLRRSGLLGPFNYFGTLDEGQMLPRGSQHSRHDWGQHAGANHSGPCALSSTPGACSGPGQVGRMYHRVV